MERLVLDRMNLFSCGTEIRKHGLSCSGVESGKECKEKESSVNFGLIDLIFSSVI